VRLATLFQPSWQARAVVARLQAELAADAFWLLLGGEKKQIDF